jgi:hypothetical protein
MKVDIRNGHSTVVTRWTDDLWRSRNRKDLCCDKATPLNCICRLSFSCPDHGHKCIGTHD